MKTKLIFLVMLIVSVSCGTNNKPLSDAQKEKIKGEVKEVVNTFYKGCEEVNLDMVLGTCLDSPDFIYINNGYAFSYKECHDIFIPVFSTMINQKITVADEKYTFPDNSTVLYSNHCKSLTNYRDGHAVLQDPTVMLLIFKKINEVWKVIYGVESYIAQNVKNTETSKELNQVELMKNFIGTWISEAGKDTTFIWEGKPYGEGLDIRVKTETKGKTVNEGIAVMAYDKNSDKFIQTRIMNGKGSLIASMWFTSKNTCEAVLYKDISNPENAQMKAIFEFISSTKFTETDKAPNKPDEISTFTLLKK
jgi:hypothetical protein